MKKKKIKLCLTKQLLNMFKLWCEWGISHTENGSKELLCTRTLIPAVDPLTAKSDWHLIFFLNITPESSMKVMKTISKEILDCPKVLLVSTLGNV